MEKIYSLEKDKIVVHDLTQFCIKHILECGQVFRFTRLYDKENDQIKYAYEVITLDKKAIIFEYKDKAEIITNDVNYFINYFDLDTDYNEIKNNLMFDEVIKSAIKYGYGIRILRQDIFEMIISFIISANNNIKRIQKSLNLISEKYGTKIDDYYAFPTFNQLKNAKVEDLRKLGVGFRDKYIVETINMLCDVDLQNLRCLNTNQLSKYLVSLKGVGQKVADCIMLFAFYKMNVFPVDTWIKQVFKDFYCSSNQDSSIKNANNIREFFLKRFGDYSGYAQQYLFYYKREL